MQIIEVFLIPAANAIQHVITMSKITVIQNLHYFAIQNDGFPLSKLWHFAVSRQSTVSHIMVLHYIVYKVTVFYYHT